MGSYNVACSISNLSIRSGDKVAFFLLLPARHPWGYGRSMGKDTYIDQTFPELRAIHRVGIKSNLLYTNCYFNPLGLPIFGEYDDYGGVEHIVDDKNTKLLETFFNLSIDQIIDCVTCGRELSSTLSALHKHVGISGEKRHDPEKTFDGSYLSRFGFVKNDRGRFSLPTSKETPWGEAVEVELVPTAEEKGYPYYNNGFRLYRDGKLLAKQDSYDVRQKFQKVFYKHIKYHVNVSSDYQNKVTILKNLSGMFVLKEVYDQLADNAPTSEWDKITAADAYLDDSMLKSLGFEFIGIDENEKRFVNRWSRKGNTTHNLLVDNGGVAAIETISNGKQYYYIGSLKDLKNNWEKLTDQTIDISDYKDVKKHSYEFNRFSNKIIAYDKLMKESKGKKYEDIPIRFFTDNPFESLGSGWGFGAFYKDWSYFEQIYKQAIKDKNPEIRDAFTRYNSFVGEMIACNRFFFPAMCGTQCGEFEHEQFLLTISKAITDKRIKEQEEW